MAQTSALLEKSNDYNTQNVDAALTTAESFLENEDFSELVQKEALNNLWSAIATLDPANNETDSKIVKKIVSFDQNLSSVGLH